MDGQEAHDFYADPAHLAVTGPGRRREGPRLTAMASVRFAPGVIDAVRAAASAQGITAGAWIRRRVDLALRDRARMAWLDAHRDDLRVVPGSGRALPPRAIPSSLSFGVSLNSGFPGTFSCPHMSIGGVIAASCGTCGPMRGAA